MKVLQVTPQYSPHTGGVETHVKEVSERLVDRGHSVTVITADAGPDVSRREMRNGVAVRRYRGVAPDDSFHFAPRVFCAVADVHADVIHAHNYHSFPMLFATLAAIDRPLVLTPHYHGRSENSIRNILLEPYERIGKRMLRRADRVIAVSDWEAGLLTSTFDVSPDVVPNGVAIERFDTAAPEVREHPYLLTVGRLEKYKGVQYAIKALAHLPDCELLVAGTGPYETNLRKIAAEHGVKQRVHFLGFVPDEQLPNLYAGAEVLLHLSDIEAYGLTVGEALASGTPCIVSTKSGLVHWTDIDGVVGVERLDPSSVVDAVFRAIRTPPSAECLSTWDDVTEAVLSIYRSVTRGHRSDCLSFKRKIYQFLFDSSRQ